MVGIRDDNGSPVLPPAGLNPAGIDRRVILPVHADFLAELPRVPVNVPVNESQQWFLEQLSAGKQAKATDIPHAGR